MINLDSILKSRDITLPTKVRLVKAMVFPVVVYGCESWTNAEYLGMNKNGGLCPPGAYTVVDFSDLIQAGKNTSR